jgi:DNA-binding transcriptional MerR regulator
MVKDRFSTREVTRQTGATARQLQWWDENQLVVPGREANRRVYSFNQILDVQLMLELRRSHLPLETVQRVLNFFHLKGKLRLAEIACSPVEWILLVNESGQWLVQHAEVLMERAARVRQPVYVFSLREVLGRLPAVRAQRSEKLPKKHPPEKSFLYTREVRRAG